MHYLYTGNVIYLQTFRMYKSLKKSLVFYKNRMLRKSEFERRAERADIEEALRVNPHNLELLIRRELLEEIERG